MSDPAAPIVSAPSSNLVSPLEVESSNSGPKIIISVFVIIIAGVISGYILSSRTSAPTSSAQSLSQTVPTDKSVKSATEIGSTDPAFKDTAEGTLEKGGLSGEGTHKLIRPGGDSQTVYLVSSIVDLDEFVGKKVIVYGQTLKAQKVGWLMDVGRLKLQ